MFYFNLCVYLRWGVGYPWRPRDLLELELQARVSGTRVLGPELGFSGRRASTLNHHAVAPAPQK